MKWESVAKCSSDSFDCSSFELAVLDSGVHAQVADLQEAVGDTFANVGEEVPPPMVSVVRSAFRRVFVVSS